MSKSPRRQHLRQATRRAHDALDARVGAFGDLAAYRRYVAGIAAFRRGVEAALAGIALPESLKGWRPQMIAGELASDSRALSLGQLEAPSEEIAAVRETLFVTPGDSALFGMLYVLEGSALGARFLLRRAAELGLNAQNGAAHLAAQAGNINGWPTFIVALEKAETFDEDAAARAANETFARAERAFAIAYESC